jgi:hypothetical protein
MGITKKATVVAKKATKKRGRPMGSKNKVPFSAPEKPVDWQQLCMRLQEALSAQIKEADSYKKLFENMEVNSKPVALLTFWQRVKLVLTGSY